MAKISKYKTRPLFEVVDPRTYLRLPPLRAEDLLYANDEPCDLCGIWLETLSEKYIGRCDTCVETERKERTK